jgi:type VI secretion system protein ImpH
VVANLVGLGTPGLGNRLSVDDAVVFRYAGHFASFPRSAAALELMLSDFCQAPVAIEQFVGQWLRLEPADQTRLATRAGTAGCNVQLGIDTIVGASVWDLESKFVIHLGPLGLDAFRQFLPGMRQIAAVGDLARLYVGQRFDISICPVLAAAAVPMTRLGGEEHATDGSPAGSRLGWTTWLQSRPSDRDRSDAAFSVN